MTHRIAQLAIALVALCALPGRAATYRVGPDERFTTISEVAGKLAPGDVVEVVGDVTDGAVLRQDGSQGRPIVIRGILRSQGDETVRPRIFPSRDCRAALWCKGNWYVIENLEFDGRITHTFTEMCGILHDCDNLTVRNCYFHHFDFKAVCGRDAGSIAIEFCEFDSIGSDLISGKTVDIWSWKPGALMRVEHCYFHDSLYEALLKTHCTRNLIRYNWFENAYHTALKITDRIAGTITPNRPRGVYPMHSDIVGNVFIMGNSPGPRYALVRTGGNGVPEAGTEGDFNIAHNLFVMNVFGRGNDATVFDLVQGNVDHVKMYNNVFLQMGGPACLVYFRDMNWDTPETRAFIKRRGSPDPVVVGSNNWIFEGSAGIPATFQKTLRGLNPRFVDLLGGDFRPREDSPLAGAGMWPLPKGQIVDLVAEYEPQRGIPADLKPRPRRTVIPPSIGPFEVPAQ